ncbi:MAG: sulfur carrier protein ThiS [Thermodesulfobacteriota bacterium]|nr:sulfur carrier protein ThiS [Thermodesulfobacteriota bacterium]
MKLIINGKTTEYQDNLTVQQLLQKLKLSPDQVVVELNRQILSPNIHVKTELKSEDTIELVQFVGGG